MQKLRMFFIYVFLHRKNSEKTAYEKERERFQLADNRPYSNRNMTLISVEYQKMTFTLLSATFNTIASVETGIFSVTISETQVVLSNNLPSNE